jgi:hypothetical protein
MRKPGKERRFDRLSLVRRKRRQSRAQQLALLAHSSTSCGSAAPWASSCLSQPRLRSFRFSKRRRSIARERADEEIAGRETSAEEALEAAVPRPATIITPIFEINADQRR